jgi:hypothetical protein
VSTLQNYLDSGDCRRILDSAGLTAIPPGLVGVHKNLVRMFGESKNVSFVSVLGRFLTIPSPRYLLEHLLLPRTCSCMHFCGSHHFNLLPDLDYGLQFARYHPIHSLIPHFSSVESDPRLMTMPDTLLWRTAMSSLTIIQRVASMYPVKV